MITQNKHALNMPTKQFKYTQQLQKKLKANEKLHYVGLQNTLRYFETSKRPPPWKPWAWYPRLNGLVPTNAAQLA